MKKFILIATACLLILSNVSASAKESEKSEVLGEAEIPSSLIRMSKDGTGIIKLSKCGDCKEVLVKVTAATKFYLNGNEISASQMRKLPKRGFVGIQYTLDSKEVRTIGIAN